MLLSPLNFLDSSSSHSIQGPLAGSLQLLHQVLPSLRLVADVLHSLSDFSPAVLTSLDGDVEVWSCISLLLLHLSSRATNGIADLLVVLLLISNAETSNGAETAAAVCVASGSDSGGSDGRVVQEVGDSVPGLLWFVLHLSAGLSTGITDGSWMNASMPVITGMKVLHNTLGNPLGNILKLSPLPGTHTANRGKIFLVSFLLTWHLIYLALFSEKSNICLISY